MPTTTNYGWTTPADTDLVKDGASAIRTLGTAIDTTVFNNASASIAKSIVDAKGDLIVGTAADTVARLAVGGTNGQVLQVDSSTASGLKWDTVAAGGMTLLTSGTLSSDVLSLSSISGSYEQLRLKIMDIDPTGNIYPTFRFNSDSGGNYQYFRQRNLGGTVGEQGYNNQTSMQANYDAFPGTPNGGVIIMDLPNYSDTTGYKQVYFMSTMVNSNSVNETSWHMGFWKDESAINAISFSIAGSGETFQGGTYELWGIK